MMKQPQMIDPVTPMMMKQPQMIDPVKQMIMKQPQMIDPMTPMMMKQPRMIDPVKPMMMGQSQMIADPVQQMYVMIFLCAFTTWTADDIQTFLSHEGFLTLSDIPRFFDLPRYRKWDIPWNDAGVEMGADIIFPDIDPTETLPSKEKVIAVGGTMVGPLPSTETLPSKEKVTAVGDTMVEPLSSTETLPSKDKVMQ